MAAGVSGETEEAGQEVIGELTATALVILGIIGIKELAMLATHWWANR